MRNSHVKGQVIAAAIQLLMTLKVMDVELAIVDLILFFKKENTAIASFLMYPAGVEKIAKILCLFQSIYCISSEF